MHVTECGFPICFREFASVLTNEEVDAICIDVEVPPCVPMLVQLDASAHTHMHVNSLYRGAARWLPKDANPVFPLQSDSLTVSISGGGGVLLICRLRIDESYVPSRFRSKRWVGKGRNTVTLPHSQERTTQAEEVRFAVEAVH